MTPFDLSLYLVTDRSLSCGRALEQVVEGAVKGGVSMVQLREKNCSTKEFYTLACGLKKCLAPHKVPLIINDRLDIALACDADGLHIGQNDIPYTVARAILGREKIIGLSVEKIEDVEMANSLDLDYIGISPVFGTPTKTDTAPPVGLKLAEQFVQLSVHPVVCIGGINKSNAAELMAIGSDGVSVVSAIMSAADPKEAARELYEIILKGRLLSKK